MSNLRAASLILGWIFSVCLTENSVAAILMFMDLITGNIDREMKIIPRPPIHCVKLLQKSIPCGKDSTSLMMLAPVVVKPEIDPKNASPKDFTDPLRRNGRVPKRLKISQAPVTIIYPSLL